MLVHGPGALKGLRLPVGYETSLGRATTGTAENQIRNLASGSVDLIFTSPPFALQRGKSYGNMDQVEGRVVGVVWSGIQTSTKADGEFGFLSGWGVPKMHSSPQFGQFPAAFAVLR